MKNAGLWNIVLRSAVRLLSPLPHQCSHTMVTQWHSTTQTGTTQYSTVQHSCAVLCPVVLCYAIVWPTALAR